jgi:hypothetical protein
MPLSERVKRIVWTKSGGRCALCREVLCVAGASADVSHLLGDVAHIVAEQDDGPRGRSALTIGQRNSEHNLLLLCLPDHKPIDDDSATYTVEFLTETKFAHEKWVTSSLAVCPVWDTKLFHLYYINVPRLSLLSSVQGISLDLSQYGRINGLHELGWELNGLMAGFAKLLQAVQLKAVPLNSAIREDDVRGMVVSFNHEFRTKNIRMPQPGESFETSFTGDPQRDPHVYCKIQGYKVVANVDRRWITTTTVFCHFRPSNGRNTFAGLGFINGFDAQARVLSVTPYVMGMPSNPVMEEFYRAISS